MLGAHDTHNLLRLISQIGRTTVERVILDSREIEDGELVDSETRASFDAGGITIETVVFNRQLDCGDVARASSISAVCDLCGRRVCRSCISVCRHCNLRICHYCSRVYADKGVEQILCKPCHWDTKMRGNMVNTSRSIFGFFIKTEGS